MFLNLQFTLNGDDCLNLTYDDLFHSPHFLNASRSSQGSNTSIAPHVSPSVSAQIDELDQFLNSSGRYDNERDRSPAAGELAWVLHRDQMNGYVLYQDIDPNTPYGALTIEMCNVGRIDYKLKYRDYNHFATALQPTSSGTVDKDDLLKLFRAQCLKSWNRTLSNNGHVIMMLKSPEYDTWDKIVHMHDAISQIVMIEANKRAYEQHLAYIIGSIY